YGCRNRRELRRVGLQFVRTELSRAVWREPVDDAAPVAVAAKNARARRCVDAQCGASAEARRRANPDGRSERLKKPSPNGRGQRAERAGEALTLPSPAKAGEGYSSSLPVARAPLLPDSLLPAA